jgi:hypothetical protein
LKRSPSLEGPGCAVVIVEHRFEGEASLPV